jgi:putative membrane protein insertion efficiency factor
MKPCCRFFPSCSDYAIEALRYYGVCKGGFLAARRLLRCHPWAKGGYDPLLAENIPPFTNEKFE